MCALASNKTYKILTFIERAYVWESQVPSGLRGSIHNFIDILNSKLIGLESPVSK